MAPSVSVDSPSIATADDANKAPDGVVLPPRDIREVIEKSAGYVARNGETFEARIRENNPTNPKFSFLVPGDAYNPYYVWRVKENKEGRGTVPGAARENGTAAKAPEKPKGPAEPPEFHFSARMPTINAQDLDVVRLTALFVAKNGRSFITSLSQKEAGNFQFDFLRPQHSLYQYFSRLVDQYTDLIAGSTIDGGKPEKARIAMLEKNVLNRFHMLDRARQRAEWVKHQEQQKQKEEESAEVERTAYAQIDWHDFVVVEEVFFTDADEQAELPPPTSLSDLQSASLEQKAMFSGLQPLHMRIEEAVPTDDPSYYENSAPAVQTPTQQSYQPQQAAILPSRVKTAEEEEEEQRIRERTEARERAQQAQAAAKGGTGPIRIKNDYVPKAQAKKPNVPTALCPQCNQLIPTDELEQHMRSKYRNNHYKSCHTNVSQSSCSTLAGKNRKRKRIRDMPQQISLLPMWPTI